MTQPDRPLEELRGIAAAYIAEFPEASAALAAFAKAEPVDPAPLYSAAQHALWGCLSTTTPKEIRGRWERDLRALEDYARHEAERARQRHHLRSAAQFLAEMHEPDEAIHADVQTGIDLGTERREGRMRRSRA